MKFEDWKIFIKESLSLEELKTKAEEIKSKIASEFNKLYVIPDFDTFKRENEPIQQNILFASNDNRTFSFNFTEKGELYSVDFWAPKMNVNKPSITMYINKGNIEDVYLVVPDIALNPNKRIDVNAILNKKKLQLVEADSNDNLSVNFLDSKPQDQLDPKVKKAEKKAEEEKYDFSDPETIFEDLTRYVNMVIKGTQPSLLVTGSPGVGKTYLITKLLQDAGQKYEHVKGRSTAAGMFQILYENRQSDKIVLFDDCDSVFGNEDAVNILKGALDSYDKREISWLVSRPMKSTTGEVIPKKFVFEGRVIFISNLPQRKIDDAIKTRSFVIEVALSPEDMITKMKHDLPFIMPEVPKFEKEIALKFIERISKKTDSLELNMRTLIKAIKILDEVNDLSIAERLIMQQCSYK
jgi:hypothetical protein